MFCIKCGVQLLEGAKFCANCGAVVGRGVSVTRPADNSLCSNMSPR